MGGGGRTLLLLALGLLSGVASAADYCQVRGNGVTAIAAGDKPNAGETASVVLRVQDAVRWIALWPDDYRPNPVLVLALTEATVEHYFGRSRRADDQPRGLHADQAMVMATESVTV